MALTFKTTVSQAPQVPQTEREPYRIKFKVPEPTKRQYMEPPKLPIPPQIKEQPAPVLDPQPLTPEGLVDIRGNKIVLDKDQYSVLESFTAGHHLVVVGKAGTGKTTVVQALYLIYHYANPQSYTDYRIRGEGLHTPAQKFAIIAYTNRAANNMRARLTVHPVLGKLPDQNITTGHNLLEYTVEFILDPLTGQSKRHYYPARTAQSKLDIDYLVIEESTMIGVGPKSLWNEIFSALPSSCKIIFLGDINQLPPVIGKPVLSYALQSPHFRLIELNHVHRQALENPIIRQAHNCLKGKPIETDLIEKPNELPLGVKVFNGKGNVKLPWWDFEHKVIDVLMHYKDQGLYNPLEDMVLSPFNQVTDKAVSAQNLAKAIASRLAQRDRKLVYEILAGYQTCYHAIGDRVFYDKEDGTITNITHNNNYMGKRPRAESYNMDYFGKYLEVDLNHVPDSIDFNLEAIQGSDYSSISLSKLLDAAETLKEEAKRSASHTVEITYSDDRVVSCSTIGEYAELQLGYALSVHKAQGSEWPNVFVVLHDTNATMLFRELLYTAMTRPQRFLGIIAQSHVLKKAQDNQRIKGNSLEAKIEFFNSGYLDQDVPLDPYKDQHMVQDQEED